MESALPKYHVCQFSCKTNNIDVFGPNLAKNEFWGQNFKNLSPDLESVPPRYSVFQFSGKIDSIDFFGPNLPKNKLRVGNLKN